MIRNAQIARKKECDRIQAITLELKKMGADIEEFSDGLFAKPSQLKGAQVFSHNDHRIALALSVAALGAEGETKISHAECINKSFSEFVPQMQEIGARISVQ